jgi:Mrp family chromosome partitioning ATPase
VLEAEKTRWPVAENTKQMIEKNGGKVLGVVLNKRQFYIPDFIYRRL